MLKDHFISFFMVLCFANISGYAQTNDKEINEFVKEEGLTESKCYKIKVKRKVTKDSLMVFSDSVRMVLDYNSVFDAKCKDPKKNNIWEQGKKQISKLYLKTEDLPIQFEDLLFSYLLYNGSLISLEVKGKRINNFFVKIYINKNTKKQKLYYYYMDKQDIYIYSTTICRAPLFK